MEATKTRNLITEAISAETESAKKNWGSTYHSKHEAWAVLREEVEEAEFETEYVKTLLQKAWDYIRHDEFTAEGHKQVVQSIKDHALSLALEAVQVAAVAQKYIDTLEEVK